MPFWINRMPSSNLFFFRYVIFGFITRHRMDVLLFAHHHCEGTTVSRAVLTVRTTNQNVTRRRRQPGVHSRVWRASVVLPSVVASATGWTTRVGTCAGRLVSPVQIFGKQRIFTHTTALQQHLLIAILQSWMLQQRSGKASNTFIIYLIIHWRLSFVSRSFFRRWFRKQWK